MARSKKRLRSLPRVTLKQLGLSELETTAAELPALTLRQYIELLAQTPLPTHNKNRTLWSMYRTLTAGTNTCLCTRLERRSISL
jgi:hypothetical protein